MGNEKKDLERLLDKIYSPQDYKYLDKFAHQKIKDLEIIDQDKLQEIKNFRQSLLDIKRDMKRGRK